MNALLQDFRYSVRRLANSPGLATVAVLSLALGIGANTAIFSLMDQALLRSLPARAPERLVQLQPAGPYFGRVEGPNNFSYPMYRDLRDGAPGFDGLAGFYPLSVALTYKGITERVPGELVSGNYFETLGIPAAAGRTITPADDRIPGAHPVAMLSWSLWKQRFGGDPDILGQTVSINGHPMTVIGVAPRGFNGTVLGRAASLYVPLMMKAQMTPGFNGLDDRRFIFVSVLGRLKDGLTPAQAQSMINAYWRPLLEAELKEIKDPPGEFASRFLNRRISLAPGSQGRADLRERLSEPLYVLMAMVALVLLIACANVAALLVAKAASRQKEIAIRLSLGAGRLRIVRQLLMESLILSVAGGAAGLLVALWTGSLILSFIPGDDGAAVLNAELDGRVLAFTFALSVLTGILFGLAPALQATRPSVIPALKDQASNISAGSAQARLRKMLVTAQVALSLVLLVGAGLFARSLYNLRLIDPGFRTEHLVQFTVDPSLGGYDQARTLDFLARAHRELAALPGVKAAAISEQPLLSGGEWQVTVTVEGYRSKPRENMNLVYNRVSPGYFQALGIPVLNGRQFTDRDGPSAPKVALINESAARYFFGSRNPIGLRMGVGRDKPDIEIVGVVRDAKQGSLKDRTPRALYLPYTQGFEPMGEATFYVRTQQDPQAMAGVLRRHMRRLDPNLPLTNMRTMEMQIGQLLSLERALATLAALFGALATVLAAVGLYGVMAYTVARRTREIGVRIALGAGRGEVLWMVMRDVALMCGIGIALALPAAWALGRLVESQLFGVTGRDALVLAGATAVIAAVAMAAGWAPAARAARVSPVSALRYE